MLIGLCGGICSGKNAVAEYLTQHQNFRRLEVKSGPPSQAVDDPRLQAFGLTDDALDQDTPLQFETTGSLLEFATKRWQEHWVTTHIWDTSTLDPFMQRPFFLLVSVDAPVSLRWKRFADRCRRRRLEPPHLEEFVLWNDKQLYKKSVGHALITDRAQLRLFNSSPSLDELHAALKELNLADEQRLRPNWDQYFMELASLAAQRSNCMKRRVGCVLVRERRVISTGYNGTPRHLKNCNEGGCPRCNRGEGGGVGLSTCLCLHAEENALLEAGRDRIREGAILYCDTCPCLTCTVKIAQVGISEVVYSQGYNMDRNVCRPYPASEFDLTRTRAPKFLTQLEYACDNFLLLEMVLSTLKGQTKDEQLQSLLPSHTPNAWTQGNPTAFGCCKSKIHELFSLLWTDSLTSVEGCMFQPK